MVHRDVTARVLSLLICITAINVQKVTAKGCRFINDAELDRQKFLDFACKSCYYNAPSEVFTVRLNTTLDELLEPEFWKNRSHPYYLSFVKESNAKRWASCCDDANSCCNDMLNQKKDDNTGCKMAWDIYGCWSKGVPHRETEVECPNYYEAYYVQEKSHCRRYARRMCQGNETWGAIKNLCDHMEFQRYKPNYEPENGKIEGERVCHRTNREVELSYDAYKQDTCAKCYDYTPAHLRKSNKTLKYDIKRGCLVNPDNKTEIYFADEELNRTGPVIDSFQPKMAIKWIQCCQAAMTCWKEMETQRQKGPKPEGYCPMTWDGWSCIKATAPGHTFADFCSDHVYFLIDANRFDCKYKFQKVCRSDGYWYRRSQTDFEFTDYTPCSGTQSSQIKLSFDISMLIISMVAIVPSLIIFNIYRTLRIPRIKMHVQLLLSLLLYCLTTCIYKGTVLYPETQKISIDNGPYCKTLVILYKYFRMCSYAWMFCEGFYLHRQIAAAFTEQRKFWYFYVAGWGFPMLLISAYAIARKVKHDENCWIPPETIEFIIYVPAILCLVMNLIFLCHIVYILVTKLRSVQSNEPGHYRKAVRATLVLIPLFGVHTFLVIFTPDSKNASCLSKEVMQYFASIIDGLQGFFVALIYCYLNNEVLNLLKNDYHRYKSMKWIGQGNQRPSRGGRWSVSTQVSAVHDHHSTHHNEHNGKAANVSHLDVPLRQPLQKTNGTLPVTEL